MKYNLALFPVAEDGTQLKDEKGNPADFRVTLKKAFTSDADSQGQPIRGEEKFKRWDMWLRIKEAPPIIELSAEEVVYITHMCRDAFPVLIAGQCRDFLRNPMKDPAKSVSEATPAEPK